jgi:L-asparagine transporter-like permease
MPGVEGGKMNVFSWLFVLLALASLGLFIVVQPRGHRRIQIPAGALKVVVLVALLAIGIYLVLQA